jgi:multiple sugar transport system substrate-binding protein
MPKPSTHDEYLASLIPPSMAAGVDRRVFMKGALGSAAALSLPALLAACGGSSGGTSGKSSSTGKATGTVSVGSYQSDPIPKKGAQAMFDGFTTKSAVKTKVNTVNHNDFQENINTYLQGTPDDVFTWFSGFRMRFFADKGLAGDISDVWTKIGADFAPGIKAASTGDDKKQYLVPTFNYPWVVMYRKSVFADKGYTPPKTLDDFKALGATMKKDGIVPMAFADKDGWPAMGTFDILNMRINGYAFHVSLMAGKESWQDAKVKTVFDTWKGLLSYHQTESLGRTWQEAAQGLAGKKAGMYFLGTFAVQQFKPGPDADDVDFFAFPEVDSAHGVDSIDAPIDGYMMSAKPKNEAGAKALLTYLASPEAELINLKIDPSSIGTNKRVDTSGYTAVQKKSAEIIGATANIAQFMDRDTRPDFASTVMIPSLQDFIKNPNDIDGLTKKIDQQAKTIFAS